MIPWIRFEVIFHNIPFFTISIITFSSDLINFDDYIKNFLISLWIRPLFTIIPLNSKHFHQISKFGIIFDAIPCEIDDLAVSSHQRPHGVVEDVIVKVENYFFLIDFIIVDMKSTKDFTDSPIILGRPFLATAKAITDWVKGEVIFQVGDSTMKVSINKLMRHPSHESHEVGAVDIYEDPETMAAIEDRSFEEPDDDPFPSGETAPKLKPLPSTLKYSFIDHHCANLVIISSQLDQDQEERLLAVLRGRKEAIGWNLSDLKGIDPSLCTHHIFLEEDSHPSREAQRRLNPKVWDAVKDEILKWLTAGIIYLISDSPWASPVHVVPKKAGITVTTNDRGEEIQTRLLTKWRVYIDYRNLNAKTKKGHFPLPFIDQIFDKLSGQGFYCFLDGYSGYNQFDTPPMIRRRRRLHVHLAHMHFSACHLDYVTLLPLFRGA